MAQVRHTQACRGADAPLARRRLRRPAGLAAPASRDHSRHRRGHRCRYHRPSRRHQPLPPRPSTSSAISAFFPRKTAPASISSASPLPPGTMRMSRKGNDLVRHYLWNAARSASSTTRRFAPSIVASQASGKRGDVALGQCMRKLLHLVYAVWKTNRPFDDQALRSGRRPGRRHDRGSRQPTTADARQASTAVPAPACQPASPPTRGQRRAWSLATTKRPWATNGTCPQQKWSPRPMPP